MFSRVWSALPQREGEAPPVSMRMGFVTCSRQRILSLIVVSFLIIIALIYGPGFSAPKENESLSDVSATKLDNKNLDGEARLFNERHGGEAPQKSMVVLDDKSKDFLDRVKKQCNNWSAEFFKTFEEKCGFWLPEYLEWLEKTMKPKPPVGYLCQDERECHGLGDRLAGIQGAFAVALSTSRPLRLSWSGLNEIFESCVFHAQPGGDWSKKTSTKGCIAEQGSCGQDLYQANQCKSSPVFFENSERGCLPISTCGKARKAFPTDLNAANLYGCGMRSLLEPKSTFLEYVLPFHDGPNGLKHLTVSQAKDLMSKYYVIGIHFRIGDKAAFIHASTRKITPEHHIYLTPFQCASTLQSYMEGWPIRNTTSDLKVVKDTEMRYEISPEDGSYSVGGRPVRWFLASDSKAVREMALQLFGDKLLMIETRPSHIGLKGRDRGNILYDTFAEWFMLGLSDALIVNRIGGKNLYRGRMSSYSKTAWAYNLKNFFYDAGTCRRRQMLLDGTWKLAPAECRKPYSFHHRLTQPHLEPLQSSNPSSSFPLVWMDRGRINMLDQTLMSLSNDGASIEEEEEDEEAEPDD